MQPPTDLKSFNDRDCLNVINFNELSKDNVSNIYFNVIAFSL